jgi:hypothetical protein
MTEVFFLRLAMPQFSAGRSGDPTLRRESGNSGAVRTQRVTPKDAPGGAVSAHRRAEGAARREHSYKSRARRELGKGLHAGER